MKNLIVSTVFALASFVAVAQTTPGTMAPSGNNPSTESQTSPSQTSDMPGAGNQASSSKTKKTEKTLKGCVESSGGQFSLEDKRGKQVTLTGSQDFASHVGHTVTAHGSYASASNSTPSSRDQFMVTKLDMVSEKCTGPKFKSKGVSNDPITGKPSPYRY